MYYLNEDIETIRRYDMSKFVEFFEDGGYDVLTSYALEEIYKMPEFGQRGVLTDEQKPDLLSYKIYTYTQFWWILMAYNSYTNFENILNAHTIRYPSIAQLEDLYFRLRSIKISKRREIEGITEQTFFTTDKIPILNTVFIVREDPGIIWDGIIDTFTISQIPLEGTEMVYVDKQLRLPDDGPTSNYPVVSTDADATVSEDSYTTVIDSDFHDPHLSFAQVFTASSSYTPTKIKLPLQTSIDEAGDFEILITGTVGGDPDLSNIIARTYEYRWSDLSTYYRWMDFIFIESAPLVSGTDYAIVISKNNALDNIHWISDGTIGTRAAYYTGATWYPVTNTTFCFEIFSGQCPKIRIDDNKLPEFSRSSEVRIKDAVTPNVNGDFECLDVVYDSGSNATDLYLTTDIATSIGEGDMYYVPDGEFRDYEIIGDTVKFRTPPPTDAVVRVCFQRTKTELDPTYIQLVTERATTIWDGVLTDFQVDYEIIEGTEMVFYNGALLTPGDELTPIDYWIETTDEEEQIIHLVDPPQVVDKVKIMYQTEWVEDGIDEDIQAFVDSQFIVNEMANIDYRGFRRSFTLENVAIPYTEMINWNGILLDAKIEGEVVSDYQLGYSTAVIELGRKPTLTDRISANYQVAI